jgi:hypothetical protein
VVDEEVGSDPGGRMYLDPREAARGVGDRPRQKRDAGIVERVGETMGEQGVDPRPAQEDLERAHTPGRGITTVRRGHVAANFPDDTGGGSESEHVPGKDYGAKNGVET